MRTIVHAFFEPHTEGDNDSVWSYTILHVLCDDGSIWYLETGKPDDQGVRHYVWERWELPEIPQEVLG